MPPGKLLWTPEPARGRKTNIVQFQKWLDTKGHHFKDYGELWKWSVDDLEGFWGSVWKYFDVADADYIVLNDRKMPGARWFEGADVNFAERVFANKRDGLAVIAKSEKKPEKETMWPELERMTASLAAKFRSLRVGPGDRVAAYLPNSTEAVVAFLACASVGAVWSCCSPDFGAAAVLDRFGQIKPKVLIASDGYSYGGKWHDRVEEVKSIVNGLPGLKRVIGVQSSKAGPEVGGLRWEEATGGRDKPVYEPLPFDHPLWVLYSSGTTGLPKAIVHGQGGILLELRKVLSLHNDIRTGDRFFWYTTTGWMMWNYLVGGLLHGATIGLYNGSPSFPGLGALWKLAEKNRVSFFGGSAAYFSSCMKAGLAPGATYALKDLRGVGSTGSPLSPENFEWAYSGIKEDLWVASISGGTDVCTAFVGGCPTLPVYSGEIQCRCLGASVEAFDEEGNPVKGRMGELVVTQPMPSMPLYFWGDPHGRRYKESYFATYRGVWRHGDWIEITSRGTCIIYGRSDATIKKMGVRIGTSEIYRVVESVPGVADSLAVGLDARGDEGKMVLFVVLPPGKKLESKLLSSIQSKIRSDLSPKYLPDEIVQVPSVPRTLNGKKLEVPVKRILMGGDPDRVLNRDSLADRSSIDFYISYAKEGAGKV